MDFIFITLGFRLQGSSCVFTEAHHLHRPRAHLGSLCRFKAFPKAEKVEFGRQPVNREERQVLVTEASQKGIWTHGHLYGNRSRYVFSTYYRLGPWGSGCWDYRVCLFKPIIFTDQRHISEVFAVSKPLQRQRRVNFNSPKVEAGQWVTGQRHHFPRKSKQR